MPRKRQKSVICSILFGAILVSSAFFIAGAIVGVSHKQVRPSLSKLVVSEHEVLGLKFEPLVLYSLILLAPTVASNRGSEVSRTTAG